jgi:N,N'-diacetylchitobiose transport system permease protein
VWLQAFNEGARGTDWGGVMAGSTLMAIPVVIFFLLVQKRVAGGLTAGAVKG